MHLPPSVDAAWGADSRLQVNILMCALWREEPFNIQNMNSRASAVPKERTHGLNESCSIPLIALFGPVGGMIDFDPPPCRRRNLGPPGRINVLL